MDVQAAPGSDHDLVIAGARSEAKATFRGLLSRNAPRLGLTTRAIGELVTQAQITYWRAGQQIFAPRDAHELVHFLIAGAVRITCQGLRPPAMTVRIVRTGQFFSLASLFDHPNPRRFGAVAHTISVVAMVSHEVMRRVLTELPPERALQLVAHSWRVLLRLLDEKCLLLMLPLGARLERELETLALDFGRPEAAGVSIDLPLTHADLAALVGGSRANVSRAMAALRRRGRIAVVGHRLLLRTS